MHFIRFASALLLAVSAVSLAADDAKPSLPKVVLIGDSIRLSYAPTVAKKLDGRAIIVSPKPNGGDSGNVLKNLETWAIKEQPDVVHFNAGIHDTKKDRKTGTFQVSPEQYEANLRKIVERLRKETKAVIIFATTTPIIDDRAAKQREKASYELLDASTIEYNRIALKVMKELNVPVDDVRAVVDDARGKLIVDDGVHFTRDGAEKLGTAVAEFVSQHLPRKP